MPVGPFETFDACVIHMKEKERYSEEVAKKICGKMQAESHEKAKMSAHLSFPQNMVKFTECPRTGDTIFHDVTIMSEGVWTDSLNKKPLTYTAEEVSKMSFNKMSFKAQHDLYGETPLTNEIGVVENARLSLNPAMWKADVRIFPTALGKDIATLIKRKQITDVSPEFFFDDILDGSRPTGIMFMGAATVRTGACRVCTFNEGIDEVKQNMTEGTPPTTGGTAGKGGVTAELNSEQAAKIAMLEQQIDEEKKKNAHQFVAQHEALAKENELLKEKVAQLNKLLAETETAKRVAQLEHELKQIQNAPVIHTTISAAMSGRRVEAELDGGEFPAISVREMED